MRGEGGGAENSVGIKNKDAANNSAAPRSFVVLGSCPLFVDESVSCPLFVDESELCTNKRQLRRITQL